VTHVFHRALVTGASSGIGRAIACQLADEGVNLVLTARDGERLDDLARQLRSELVEVECLPADLSIRDDVDMLCDRIQSPDDRIDLLVNNAGLGFTGPVSELDLDDQRQVIDVNVTAMHDLCLVAAQTFGANTAGGILNVSSMAGWMPGPRGATYGATKAFVTALSRSLHTELEPKGVAVTALCPGFTRTEFQDRAGYDASEIPSPLWQSAEAVAAVGLAAVREGHEIAVPGIHNKMAAGVVRHLPSPAFRAMSRLFDRD